MPPSCFGEGCAVEWAAMTDDKQRRLDAIVRGLDGRIERQIGGAREHFISASYWPGVKHYDYLLELQGCGFDNYPMASIENPNAMFFMERMLGCEMRHVDGRQDFFHTFCVPCIKEAGDVDKITVDFSKSPIWEPYYTGLQAHAVSPEASLPIPLPAFCPVDAACAMMGQCEFLMLLAEDIRGACHVIDFISEAYMGMIRQIRKVAATSSSPSKNIMNIRGVGINGYPGVYVSDLSTVNLSPQILEKLVPFYKKVADFAGGMTLNIAVPDIALMRDIVSVPSFHGFFFDARLGVKDISTILGKKIFIIYHYIFDDTVNGVGLKNGEYVNPIVHAHSRNIAEVFEVLAERHSIMAMICRRTKQEAMEMKEELCRWVK